MATRHARTEYQTPPPLGILAEERRRYFSRSWLLVLAGAGGILTVAGLAAAYVAGGRSDETHACPMPDDALGTFVRVDGGGFIRGAEGVYPEEGRPVRVFVSPFLIQVHEVTNDQFERFAAATGHVTQGERAGGSARFVETATPEDAMSWWRLDAGATWRTPEGDGSSLEGKGRHPVVHVTLDDARAYAAWAGGRLPTEVEWEYAASLGLFDPADPESGVRGPAGEPRANVWTGPFPAADSAEDGFAGTAPVGCYAPSAIGTHDMIGNVWEWTESPFGRGAGGDLRFTLKGGSYLCSREYCRRARPAARQALEPDFSTAHVGFRIVKDP